MRQLSFIKNIGKFYCVLVKDNVNDNGATSCSYDFSYFSYDIK